MVTISGHAQRVGKSIRAMPSSRYDGYARHRALILSTATPLSSRSRRSLLNTSYFASTDGDQPSVYQM